MNVNEWVTIPVLPCTNIGETLAFWEKIGFAVTYRQDRPYQYGVVSRNGHSIHFVRVKGADSGYAGCLIGVSDVQDVHEQFCKSLKTHLGKVPFTGVPRISRMKPGQSRFTITDVSGNSVICVEIGEKDQQHYEQSEREGGTALQKALVTVIRLRDFKEDYAAAAKVLDNAFSRIENESPEDIAEAWIIRWELARVLEEPEVQAKCETSLADLHIAPTVVEALKRKHLWEE